MGGQYKIKNIEFVIGCTMYIYLDYFNLAFSFLNVKKENIFSIHMY